MKYNINLYCYLGEDHVWKEKTSSIIDSTNKDILKKYKPTKGNNYLFL